MNWPELVPFDDADARDVPDFPLDVLPPSLGRFAASIAANLLTPIDLPAVAALGVASAAVAGRARLRVSADWYEPANLYLLAVLPPSLHKSPTLKLVAEPFEVEEAALVERWREAERRREAERDELKRERTYLGKKKPTPDLNARIAELRAKETALAPTPRPELLSDDATSEALIRKLQHGPLFVAAAEGRPFELMSGLYRRPGEDGADVYLKAWSEDTIRSSRVTSGDVFIPRPNLTLFLAVQPAVIAKLAQREDFRGRGLIARFLCTYPRTRVGWRDWRSAQPIDRVAKLNYGHAITSLLSLPRPAPGESTPLVHIHHDAEPMFLAYRQELERAQRKGAGLREWQDLGGKLAGHCARLALVLHMAAHGPEGLRQHVSAETMTAAVALTRYFVRHTIETWEGCATEPTGARVVRWLEQSPRRTVTQRDVQRAFSRLFRKAADARSMLVELAERGYLAPTDDPGTWEVSPRLYERPEAVGSVGKRRQTAADSETARFAEESRPFSRVSAVSAVSEAPENTTSLAVGQ